MFSYKKRQKKDNVANKTIIQPGKRFFSDNF